MVKNIAIIGAGAAGLSAARHSLAAGHQVVVFEQTDRLGGTWVYREQVGLDANGQEIHSSMYNGLFTNLPKEIMCYPDVPMAEQPDSFIPSADVLAYLDTFADRFTLRPHIRFGHQVIRVRPVGDPTVWVIIVRQQLTNGDVGDGGHFTTHHFDAVFVCNGHYSVPNIPPYLGRHQFAGNLLHSHAYRRPEPFAGRTVLIIGGGPSGGDIAAAVAGANAERVAWSHHRPLSAGALLVAPSVEQRPAVERFTETEVVFVDGRSETYTDVILCTGYKYAFPFLSADCGLWVEHSAFVRPLFKECINIEHPTMFVLGLPTRVCPLQVVDFQARFCLAFLDGGAAQLPTRAEMLATTAADMQLRRAAYGESNVRHTHALDTFQATYYADLVRLAGLVVPLKPYVLRIYEETARHRSADASRYRRQRFRIVSDEEYTRTEAED